uniref:t-SNARE coiled-coil homology domain-containing protein n=1 Tax=Schistocephalus solidus TaxID=70667 RepID=A0A0X3P0T1_SCHSO
MHWLMLIDTLVFSFCAYPITMSVDYCDRSAELVKCAQLFHQKVMSGRARLKPRLSVAAAAYKIPLSSLYRGQFLPSARHILARLNDAEAKMSSLKNSSADPGGQPIRIAEALSAGAHAVQSEVVYINSYLQQLLKFAPQVLQEVASRPQVTRHVQAIVSTLEHRMAALSMGLRDFYQDKKQLLSVVGSNEVTPATADTCSLGQQHHPDHLILAAPLDLTPPHVETSGSLPSFPASSAPVSSPSSNSSTTVPFNRTSVNPLTAVQHAVPHIPSHKRALNSFGALPPEEKNQLETGHWNHDSQTQNQLQLTLTEAPQSVIRQRDRALNKTEQTIVQLGEIYQQFSFLVKEQGELVTRIDTHLEDAGLNVDLAHNHLVDFMRRISSRRAFMLKLFATLIIVFCIFAFLLR